MEGLVMAGQLILGLSILVGVHEFGHLLAAKAFGMRVEKYSIGFPPKIWGFQYGETEYSLGAIPLGGYVKITGMIDESLDTESLSAEPEAWEFRSKPAWQRLIVMMGGIFVNVITGIIIFVFMTYSNGESFLAKEELNKHGIIAYDLGQELGLKTGDKILQINGADYKKFGDLMGPDVFLSDNAYYTVERDGVKTSVDIPADFLDSFVDNKDNFISFRNPFKVGQVAMGTGADKGGLLRGDMFISINDSSVVYFDELQAQLKANAGKGIIAKVKGESGTERKLSLQVD
jgi:regulator of sigma E protease